ncbi:hypothetical protein B0H14DRAFT_179190 [Mycena olivaceomarginata]|nr:hypothetical protein B0H14DRAFT_179190 [Mycena olivaceomarginata]
MLRSLTRCRHREEVRTLRRKRSPASFTHRESAIEVEEDHEWAHGDLEWATLERREEMLWLCVLHAVVRGRTPHRRDRRDGAQRRRSGWTRQSERTPHSAQTACAGAWANPCPSGAARAGGSGTPKLFSRLANLSEVASPGRKGSAGEAEPTSEREGKDVKDKDKEKRGVGFPFHFGVTASKALPPTPRAWVARTAAHRPRARARGRHLFPRRHQHCLHHGLSREPTRHACARSPRARKVLHSV